MSIEQAKKDPSSVFKKPSEVLETAWSREDKIKVLRQWEYDARELEVAAEENMADDQPSNLLSEIRQALGTLGVDFDENSSPTKQGGE